MGSREEGPVHERPIAVSPPDAGHRDAEQVGHTPGPWRALPAPGYGWDIIAGDFWVADIHNSHGDAEGFPSDEEGARNARLIAAAPDLLESLDPDTLEAIADEIDCFEHSARASGLRLLAKRQRAAIAKVSPVPADQEKE